MTTSLVGKPSVLSLKQTTYFSAILLRFKQKTQTWFSKPLSDSRRAITSSGIWGFSKAPYGEYSSDQWSLRWKFLVLGLWNNKHSSFKYGDKWCPPEYVNGLSRQNVSCPLRNSCFLPWVSHPIFPCPSQSLVVFPKECHLRIRSDGTKSHALGRKLGFQNKGRSRWTGTSRFVLEVPLCNMIRPSMCDLIRSDRVLQRAYRSHLSWLCLSFIDCRSFTLTSSAKMFNFSVYFKLGRL